MERINHSLAELIKRNEHDGTTSSSVARWLEKRPQAHLDHRSKRGGMRGRISRTNGRSEAGAVGRS